MNEFTGFLFTPVLNFHSARIPLVLQVRKFLQPFLNTLQFANFPAPGHLDAGVHVEGGGDLRAIQDPRSRWEGSIPGSAFEASEP